MLEEDYLVQNLIDRQSYDFFELSVLFFFNKYFSMLYIPLG